MRLRLILHHRPNQLLPVNYQYLLSSWIYRTLGNANAEYATQLHDYGYRLGKKQYKLFTFGPLRPKWFNLNPEQQTFSLERGPTTIDISFFMDEALQHFVVGLFKGQRFELSSGRFRAVFKVADAIVLPKPYFNHRMRFRLATPMCISERVSNRTQAEHRSPEEEGYSRLLINNLVRKQQALLLQAQEVTHPFSIHTPSHQFRILSSIKCRPRHFKGNTFIAYQYDFELAAPSDLLELGYFTGFGEKNSGLGLGMANLLK